MKHVPVMTEQMIHYLNPKKDGVYIDGSFGGGGHARALIEAAECVVLAIDQDPDAIQRGQTLCADFPQRFTLQQGRFSDLEKIMAQHEMAQVDGIGFDAGISSFQLDDAARGFSYQHDGALDMRMNNQAGKTASDWVNDLSENDLAHIIGVYGEEKIAKPIARAIIKARSQKPITSTKQLAEIILSVRSLRAQDRIHPATRTFQALRILVNDELTELMDGLCAAEQLLKEGGRLVIISFHSLEDRIVKNFLKKRGGVKGAGVNRYEPAQTHAAPSFKILTPRPLRPSAEEVRVNRRARSAKLRAAERTRHPAHPAQSIKPIL